MINLASELRCVVCQNQSLLESDSEIAKEWMSIAQCFAGAAEQPPKPGLRKKVEK